MKRILLITTLLLSLTAAQAQTSVKGSRFSDNWSAGIKGGIASPFKGGAFWPRSRTVAGIDLRKQVTPVLGLGIDAGWGINTSSWLEQHSSNIFDSQYLGIYGAVNFMNAFARYKGVPRTFEMEGMAGIGWLHSYYPESKEKDGNTWGTKAGINFNINLGGSKQWTVSLMPRILWNMGAHTRETNIGMSSMYDLGSATFELTAGITYHFGNNNGTHSFVLIKPYDLDEIDTLNSEINRLRAELATSESDKSVCNDNLQTKQNEYDDCMNHRQVKTIVRDLNNTRYIFFNVGSANVQPDQKPNIWMLAKTAKENKGCKIRILGYASQDGSLKYNKILATKRAQAVKNALIEEGIPADDIEANGEGIGHLFDINNWNRVASCTIIMPE